MARLCKVESPGVETNFETLESGFNIVLTVKNAIRIFYQSRSVYSKVLDFNFGDLRRGRKESWYINVGILDRRSERSTRFVWLSACLYVKNNKFLPPFRSNWNYAVQIEASDGFYTRGVLEFRSFDGGAKKTMAHLIFPANKNASNSTLRVICKVEVKKSFLPKVPDGRLQHDLGQMLKSGNFADVEIHCSGRVFRCSKAVLSARSAVFNSMFKVEMKESLTGKIEIKDMGANVLEQVLTFIYTDADYVYDGGTAADVLGAAEKYGLGRLKAMCEGAILKNISEDNAVELLCLAKLYSSDNLRQGVLTFLKSRSPEELTKVIENSVFHKE